MITGFIVVTIRDKTFGGSEMANEALLILACLLVVQDVSPTF